MKKFKFFALAAALMIAAACSEPLDEAAEEATPQNEETPAAQASIVTDGETVLGRELENPYSLEYMRKALAELKKNNLSKSNLNIDISANYLYVRFLPADAEEFKLLTADTTIELFDRPMLNEIEQEGEFYHDPSLPEDAITWQYTSVPVDYKFPDIKYEILDSCFVPEDEPETLSKRGLDFPAEQLTAMAFKLAGQEYDFTLAKKRKVPQGDFRVYDTRTGGYTGIAGIRVRVYNGIRWDKTHTDANGHYKMSKHYATGVHYFIKFHTSDDVYINNLMFDIDAANRGLGWHSKGGYSEDFGTGSRVWMWGTVNNAIYVFKRELCPHFGITFPSMYLHVFASNGKSRDWAGCTPMARHIKVDIGGLLNLCSTMMSMVGVKQAANALAPDVMIFPQNDTKRIYSTVFHEMAHVLHYKKVGENYWRAYTNFITAHLGYGKRSHSNSGVVGIGEMWGNYFGHYLCDKYYLSYYYDSWKPNEDWYKPGIMAKLQTDAGLTPAQIFDCLTADVRTYESLKNKLKSKYGKGAIIDKCFAYYGF